MLCLNDHLFLLISVRSRFILRTAFLWLPPDKASHLQDMLLFAHLAAIKRGDAFDPHSCECDFWPGGPARTRRSMSNPDAAGAHSSTAIGAALDSGHTWHRGSKHVSFHRPSPRRRFPTRGSPICRDTEEDSSVRAWRVHVSRYCWICSVLVLCRLHVQR